MARRTNAMRCRAEFAALSPPRLRRWRVVRPDEAGMGAAPQSIANAASEVIRSGLSPAVISSCAAVIVAIPFACMRAGLAVSTSWVRSASCAVISASSCW